MKKTILNVLMLSSLVLTAACKRDFLDIKQNISQAVPRNISDFQAILDNSGEMNAASSHGLGMLGGDEYFIQDGRLSNIKDAYQRNGYIWAREIHEGESCPDWNNAYSRILLSNLSLEGIEKIKPVASQQAAWNNVKGCSLFFRAINFYQLAQEFCNPYDPATKDQDMGIPLRLESDISLKISRGTVGGTYQRIILDLKEAADLLPEKPLIKNRPSRLAALAMQAKTYLLMGDYQSAAQYADQCLQINNYLIDLKTLKDLNQSYPLTEINIEENNELIFLLTTTNITLIAVARFNAAADLLNSYEANDLRKQAWFYDSSGRVLFGGGYLSGKCTGLAVNEVILIRAECRARTGNLAGALEDLNYLLRNRYNSSFIPLAIADQDALLKRILEERKKELVMRGTRWEDLRRLNKEGRFAKMLTRTIDGNNYQLPPNDPRYVYPIPEQEILMSGIRQNLR
ncbi:MAG TPA: RagB/SusD family nutrient uptake outer membrane protein [Pedobacter sp.]|uniref:RagB/SusD family nutrient uptake outer membrane protein n=1 Tax=Pedobacter sp. TaxID=1411316 RepID=UPI002B7A2E7C|nr:RagB/SusD family nutrient uptake outer membrane protein [Pedobacter sp.]HMI05448.1 RagB/SusD family nutrient uptake outer membrane protein [Pedobacter sp.]